MSVRRACSVVVAAALLLSGACASGEGSGDSGPPGSPTSSPPAPPRPADSLDDPLDDPLVEALVAAGIQVVADDGDIGSVDAPVIIHEVQARRLLAGVAGGHGVLGVTLDELAPLPADVPPMSYLVAAWVTVGESVAARTARSWMGEQSWERAPEIRFPEAVVLLFVNDIAGAVDAAAPHSDDSLRIDTAGLSGAAPPGPGVQGFARPAGASAAAATGPCSGVQQFLSAAIASVVNALHVKPVGGSGIFADIANTFVSVFNAAVALAARAVAGLIDQLTAPVYDVIRAGIAALGIATHFATYFRDARLAVTTEPSGPHRFAIGAEADRSGELVARADQLTGEWPAALVDCANATKVRLPEPVGAGADATWVVRQPVPVISATSTTNQVGGDLAARLVFTTGRESEEDAKGSETNSAAFVTVRIPRKDVDDLLRLGRDEVRSATAILLGRIPITPLRDLAAAALEAIIAPVLARVEQEIAGAAAGLFSFSGQHVVYVQFHIPPDPSLVPTTPAPTEPTAGDFCQQLRDLIHFAEFSDAAIVPWANEIVDRLGRMRRAAPADLVDEVDVLTRVYSAVAAQDDILVLIDTAEPLPAASATLGAHCDIASTE